MLCLFGSCFSGRTNAVSSRDGSHIDNEDLRPRHMLVRHSAKKQGLFAQQRSFGRSSVSLVDEKLALKGVEAGFPETAALLHEDDEEVGETYLSEKRVESGVLDEPRQVEVQEEAVVQKRHFHRRGILFRKPKTVTRNGVATLMLKTQNTGDEMQRRLDFERQAKKMNQDAAEQAWAAERKRRQEWEHEYKISKSMR